MYTQVISALMMLLHVLAPHDEMTAFRPVASYVYLSYDLRDGSLAYIARVHMRGGPLI